MNYFYKRSNFYYLAIPIAAAIWVLVTSTIMTSSANDRWDKINAEWEKGDKLVKKILIEDQDILKPKGQRKKGEAFDYLKVFSKFAGANSIPPSVHTYNAPKPSTRRGITTQGATLTIKLVQIEPLTRFLTEMLDTWPNLECDTLTLQKLKTGLDDWKADLKFKYTY